MRSAHAGVHRGTRAAPESRTGKWTVALATASLAGIVLSAVGFATGVVTSASSFSDNWLLTAWGAAVLATAVASVVAGALAIVRRHDRAWTVFLATGLGLVVTTVMLNEVAQGL
jgi:hypothetical protein